MDLTHWEQKQFVFLYVLGLCWHLLIWFCVSLSVNKEIQTQWSLRIGSALSLCAYIKLKTILISSVPNNCPIWGWDPCFSSPTHQGQVQSIFFPLLSSSYHVLDGSVYSFPVVRYSCPLSAGVLQDLLCLKVYSWYICGERCTPLPPTPQPPSVSSKIILISLKCQTYETHSTYDEISMT